MHSLKKFTSICIALSFLVETYTGIILFIAPKTRVANAINWELFGLDKAQTVDLHITFMIILIASMILHLYFNWKPMMSYFKNKAREVSFTSKEFIAALLINALFVFGTLYHVPPLQTFLDWGLDIRESWSMSTAVAPAQPSTQDTKNMQEPSLEAQGISGSGYGRLTLEQGAQKANISIDEAIKRIKEKGFEAKPKSNFRDISDALGITPTELLELLKG